MCISWDCTHHTSKYIGSMSSVTRSCPVTTSKNAASISTKTLSLRFAGYATVFTMLIGGIHKRSYLCALSRLVIYCLSHQ